MFSLVPNFILQALICGQLWNHVILDARHVGFLQIIWWPCSTLKSLIYYHIIALAVCILFDLCLLPGRQDAFLQSSPTPVAPSSLAAMLMIRSSGLVINFGPFISNCEIEQYDSGVQAVGHTHRRHLARDGQSSRLQTFPPLPTLALLRTGGFIRHIHWSTDQNLIFSRWCQNNFCVRWYLNYLAEGATCWADFSSAIQLAGEIFRIFLSRKSFLHFPVFFRLSAAESMNHIYFSDLSQAVKSG